MIQSRLSLLSSAGLLLALAGCPSDDAPATTSDGTETSDPTGDPTTNQPTTGSPTTNDPTSDSVDTTVGPETDGDTDTDGDTETETETDTEGPQPSFCERLGEAEGIGGVVDAALAGVMADHRINGYFLNADVDGAGIRDCLVIQLAALAECEDYEYPTDECRPMDEAHLGLGISQNDFDDLAGHFATALDDASVVRDDVATIMTALGGMAGDIVEDANSNLTRYQRIGRKPGIHSALENFMAGIATNLELAAFFVDQDEDPIESVASGRLVTCLTRQLCDQILEGPCVYGAEVDAPAVEPGVASDAQCLEMAPAHDGVENNAGDPISSDNFDAFAGALRTALMNEGNLTLADESAILSWLVAMQGDIVPQ